MTADSVVAADLRLDKWLWFARFCKTRALAQKLIGRRQVTINGRSVSKSSASARVGDHIVVTFGPIRRAVTVRGLGSKRESAPAARLLYDEPNPPEKLISDDAALPLRKPLLMRGKGQGRPTKKDRRTIAKHFGGRWDADT